MQTVLNYTTTISATKTIDEVEKLLINHGARSVMKEYEKGKVSGLSFIIDGPENIPLSIRLPLQVEAVYTALKKMKEDYPNKQIKVSMEQAERVSWRQTKMWLEIQLQMVDLLMMDMMQVFLPQIIDNSGQTLYDRISRNNYRIEQIQGGVKDASKSK